MQQEQQQPMLGSPAEGNAMAAIPYADANSGVEMGSKMAAPGPVPMQQQQQQGFAPGAVAMPGDPAGSPAAGDGGLKPPELSKAYDMLPGETLLNGFHWNTGGCCSQIGGLCGGVDQHCKVTTERLIVHSAPCCGGASCGAAGCMTQDVNNVARTVFEKEHDKYSFFSLILIVVMWVLVIALFKDPEWKNIQWFVYITAVLLLRWFCIFMWTRCYPRFTLQIYVEYQEAPEVEMSGKLLLNMALQNAGATEHALRIAQRHVAPLQPGQALAKDPTDTLPGETVILDNMKVDGGVVKVTTARLIITMGACASCCDGMGACCDRSVLIEPVMNVDKLVYDAVPYFGRWFRLYAFITMLLGIGVIAFAQTRSSSSDDDNAKLGGLIAGIVLIIVGFVILLLRKNFIVIGVSSFHGDANDIYLDSGCSNYSEKLESAIRFAQRLQREKGNKKKGH